MSSHPSIRIGNHPVGLDHPTYFLADIAANHDGSLERAVELIHVAAAAGADGAKFQHFRAETIVSDVGFRALGDQMAHQAEWGKPVAEVYTAASVPLDWSATLRDACADAGVEYLTAPYDLELIKALSSDVCAWKVGSGDITWHESIDAMARDGKPILLATGAADMSEVDSAVSVIERHTRAAVLMQCNTNYSGRPENFRYIALNVLKTFAARYPWCVLGLSDHTPGLATALGAVALGARVVEKHLTDDRGREGPDHGFSMDPPSWKEMVERTRELELALGPEEKFVMENERETFIVQRRALRATRDLVAGTRLRRDDLAALRPCPLEGLPPYRIGALLGATLRRDVERGDCLRVSDIE